MVYQLTWNRNYNLDLILGNPDNEPLWDWRQWSKLVPLLDPLMRNNIGSIGVASTQFEGKKPVKFGRLGWDDKSHQKWTHNSPLSSLAIHANKWKFLSTEIWVPSRGSCARDGHSPDIFFFLRNEGFWGEEGLTINPLVLISIAQDVDVEMLQMERSLASYIASVVDAKLHATKSRPWAISTSTGVITDSIADIAVSGLFKPGPVRKQQPTTAILSEDWELS